MALFCVIYDSYAVRELLRLRAINIYNKSQIEQGMKENSTAITIRSDESVFFMVLLAAIWRITIITARRGTYSSLRRTQISSDMDEV